MYAEKSLWKRGPRKNELLEKSPRKKGPRKNELLEKKSPQKTSPGKKSREKNSRKRVLRKKVPRRKSPQKKRSPGGKNPYEKGPRKSVIRKCSENLPKQVDKFFNSYLSIPLDDPTPTKRCPTLITRYHIHQTVENARLGTFFLALFFRDSYTNTGVLGVTRESCLPAVVDTAHLNISSIKH